jgi:hypothetical protein
MERLGEINDRQVFYIKVTDDDNWFDKLPSQDWLAIPIGDKKAIQIYSKLADNCYDRKLVYMCALGQSSELIHDIFDETKYTKKIERGESIDSRDDFEDTAITTWHKNFDEGFWFALNAAFDGDKLIDKVVCIDYTTSGVKNYLVELLDKFHQKWLPSEEEILMPKYDS